MCGVYLKLINKNWKIIISCHRLDLETLRATSHMSWEPWPCNGEDLWLSSKCYTMGVGKLFYVVTGPQAWCEVRMDHVVGPLHALLAEKEGRIWFNIICFKLYQFKIITWWCMLVLEFTMESNLKYVLKFVLLPKILKKSRSTRILVDHAPLFTTCHVGLHVDFSSMNFSWDL